MENQVFSRRGGGGRCTGRVCIPPPPHRPLSFPPFGFQGPTFRAQSVEVKNTYTYHIFSLWDSNKRKINLFMKQANSFHPKIKFAAEISENETSFLLATLCKGGRLKNKRILDIRTRYKPTETLHTFHL